MQGNVETRVGIFVFAALAIFVYLGFQIGAFRVGNSHYHVFMLHFKDISGLSRKAEIKIAGVKVGWVEDIRLIGQGKMVAQAKILVHKDYPLYHNAYALIRQDGLLGSKYLELIPGDPSTCVVPVGSTLSTPGEEAVGIDELFQKLKKIASDVEMVTGSLQKTIGTIEGQTQLHSLFDNIDQATRNISSFCATLERTVLNNEHSIDAVLQIGNHVERISDKLEKTSNEVRSSFETIGSVVHKIDQGQGILGKFINEDDTYAEIKSTVDGMRNYLTQIEMLRIVFDTYCESMLRPGENYNFQNSKGYFNVRLYTAFDYFLMFQLVGSEKGFGYRYEINPSYRYLDGCPVDTATLDLSDQAKIEHVYTKEIEIFNRGAFRFGAQIGKMFGPVAFRLGIFENTAGGAVDFDIPLCDGKLRCITTFEAFDFNGWNRKNDRSPHLKWLNRMFLFDTIYLTFGADDFISRRNASVFIGAGLRFGDDEIKYLFPHSTPTSTSVACYNSRVTMV